jgi:hypothetical protein
MRQKRILAKTITTIFLVACFNITSYRAQILIEEEPERLYYEWTQKRVTNFWEMKNFRDVFHKNKFLLGKNRIMGNIAYNTGRVIITDEKLQTHDEYRSAISFATRIRFLEQFSFNTNFYIDFNKKANARWISEFTYSVARYHWKPNRFNYGYENYLDNRYSDNISELGQKFLEGYYFVSYTHLLPENMRKTIKIDNSTMFKLMYFARYAIKYRDALNRRHGGLEGGKFTIGAAARYSILMNIYVEGAVYYYPEQYKQMPWDPDYTYGFGYFNYHSFRISLTYGNWAVNRWPGRKKAFPEYGFLDGQFRFVINWIW